MKYDIIEDTCGVASPHHPVLHIMRELSADSSC